MENKLIKVEVNNNLCFLNVGEDPEPLKQGWDGKKRRDWRACLKYGFISAGQGKVWSDQIKRLKIGDVIAAYITGFGYVGIGVIEDEAKSIEKITYKGKGLKGLPFIKDCLFDNIGTTNAEFAVKIKWINYVSKENAFFRSKSGLFATQAVCASLLRKSHPLDIKFKQQNTIDFLEQKFNVKFILNGLI